MTLLLVRATRGHQDRKLPSIRWHKPALMCVIEHHKLQASLSMSIPQAAVPSHLLSIHYSTRLRLVLKVVSLRSSAPHPSLSLQITGQALTDHNFTPSTTRTRPPQQWRAALPPSRTFRYAASFRQTAVRRRSNATNGYNYHQRVSNARSLFCPNFQGSGHKPWLRSRKRMRDPVTTYLFIEILLSASHYHLGSGLKERPYSVTTRFNTMSMVSRTFRSETSKTFIFSTQRLVRVLWSSNMLRASSNS